VYFSDAVRGDSAAGDRAHVHRQLAVMTPEPAAGFFSVPLPSMLSYAPFLN
jgi:hypothetical protein